MGHIEDVAAAKKSLEGAESDLKSSTTKRESKAKELEDADADVASKTERVERKRQEFDEKSAAMDAAAAKAKGTE